MSHQEDDDDIEAGEREPLTRGSEEQPPQPRYVLSAVRLRSHACLWESI
jgi:hypothetical protein